MTEDEARGKWCPFARDSNTGGNRLRYGGAGEAVDAQYGAEAAGEFPCIGSACMAWRRTPVEQTPAWDRHVEAQMTGAKLGGDAVARARAEDVVRRNDGSLFVEGHEKLSGIGDGFCGLAGHP